MIVDVNIDVGGEGRCGGGKRCGACATDDPDLCGPSEHAFSLRDRVNNVPDEDERGGRTSRGLLL